MTHPVCIDDNRLIFFAQAMYAQMVYKDRKILELNNIVLEMDRRVMDLQELAGEKQEVIRGRDRVVEVSEKMIYNLVCVLLLMCLHVIVICHYY